MATITILGHCFEIEIC